MLGPPRKKRPPTLESLESRLLLSRRGLVEATDAALESKVSEVASYQRESLIITTMGDSISAGLSSTSASLQGIPERASYRPYLEAIVASEAAVDVQFVGTSEYNMPKGGSSHSAYRGSATYSFFPHHGEEELGADPFGEVNVHSRFANGWATLDADVVLVLLGVNDLIQGRTVEYDLNRKNSVEGSMREMIRSFRADQPGVEILVGTTPRVNSAFAYADQIPVLNEMIHNLATPDIGWIGSTAESTIHVVDHHAGIAGLERFDVELHAADGVHPNAAGDDLLAANWWSVLEPVLIAEASKPPVTRGAEAVASTEVADEPNAAQSDADVPGASEEVAPSESTVEEAGLAEPPIGDTPVQDVAGIESTGGDGTESPTEDDVQQPSPVLDPGIADSATESNADNPLAEDDVNDTGKPSLDGKKTGNSAESDPDVEVEVPADEQLPFIGPIQVAKDELENPTSVEELQSAEIVAEVSSLPDSENEGASVTEIEPEIVDPEVVEPEVVEPEVVEPEVGEPEVVESEVVEPEVVEPEVVEPEVVEPEVVEPEVVEPEVVEPEVVEPEAVEPEVVEPEVVEPEVVEPEVVEPEVESNRK